MTDYLVNSTPTTDVIPDYVQNFAEASMYVMESVNDDFFAVLEESGIVDENGVITEAEGGEGFKAKVAGLAESAINALKQFWAKIQEWFASVKKWFDDQVEKFKKSVAGLVQKASDATIGKIQPSMLDGVKADKKFGSLTLYDKALDDGQYIPGLYKTVSTCVGKVLDGVSTAADEKKVIEKELGGADAKSIAKFAKDLYVTSTEKNASTELVRKHFDEIKSAVFGNTTKSVLSKAYTTAKAAINDSIKQLNKMKTHGLKQGDAEKLANKMIASDVLFCKNANQALHAYHSAVVGLLRARFVQYAHIIRRAVIAAIGAKAKAKLAKNESVEPENITLESMMEW